MSEEEKENRKMAFRILSDEEFLAMVANKGNPAELNQAMLALRRRAGFSCLTMAATTR